MSDCRCPRIDGYRIRNRNCSTHGHLDAEVLDAAAARKAEEARKTDDIDAACAWSDYRADYGVTPDHLSAAHKAFLAGWKAAREGDQSSALR